MKFIKWMLVLCCSLPLFARDLGVIWDNNSGVNSIVGEDFEKSYRVLLQALAQAPENLVVRMNLALNFMLKEDWDKALKEFDLIAKGTKDVEPLKEIRFFSLFNKALVLTKQEKVDEALESYQEALELRPDSLEVKTNIELLTQNQKSGGKGKNNKNKKNKKPSDGENEKDKKDPQDGEKPKDDKQDGPPKEKKEQQKQKAKMLNKNDIRKILEELKNQEQKIRAKEFGKKTKKKPNGKDW